MHQAGEVTETAPLCLLPSFVFIILLPLSLASFYLIFPSKFTGHLHLYNSIISHHTTLLPGVFVLGLFFITSAQELSNCGALTLIKIVTKYLNVCVVSIFVYLYVSHTYNIGCRTKCHTTDCAHNTFLLLQKQLRAHIVKLCLALSEDLCGKVVTNARIRLQEVVRQNGGHIEHVLH